MGMAGPAKGKKRKKKLKAELPPPTGEEDLGESASIGASKKKEPPKPARNARDLRLKVLVYLGRMTRRAARISRLMLKDARRLLTKARIKHKNLKTYVKNAQSLLKVERQRMGTDASLQQGSCLGNTCYRGIMFKADRDGVEETWICKRG